MKQLSSLSAFKKKSLALLLLLSLTCSTLFLQNYIFRQLPHLEATSADTAFRKFTASLFRDQVASNTLNLHFTLQNPESYNIQPPPVSFGGFDMDSVSAKSTLENCQTALSCFSNQSLSQENQLTYDILTSYLETLHKGLPYQIYEEPLNPITGIPAQLPVLLAEFQFQTTEDIDTYLNLLKTTPEYFNSLIHLEKEKGKHRFLLPEPILQSVIEQCESLLAMGEKNYLYSSFEERIAAFSQMSTQEKNSYRLKNQQVIQNYFLPAYQELIQALKILSKKGQPLAGICRLPKGKEYYKYLVERDTGSSRSIPELKHLILSQIREDTSALNILIRTSNFSSSSFPNQPDQILETLKSQMSKTFPLPANVSTEIKYIPKSMEPYLSPAFYLIPCIDRMEHNTIYINQAHNMDPLKQFTTLAHEGYPGHLYQTTYFANKHPDPIRSILNFGGYTEGWATYVEMCSYYLAPIPKKEAALAQKNCSLLLGLYAFSDIGIHYDGWSLQDTINFFSRYGITDQKAITDIYQLIISDPGNYLKYYIGYIELLELKKEVAAQLGDAFSQKAFHKAILDMGPAPFDVLRKHIYHYL